MANHLMAQRTSSNPWPPGQLPGLPRFRGVPEGVGGQVQPRPAAVDELVQVPGQALVEVVVFGDGTDRPFGARRAVHAERDRSDLPAVPLRGVVPALHVADLPRARITGNRLPVRPFPLRAARVRLGAGTL